MKHEQAKPGAARAKMPGPDRLVGATSLVEDVFAEAVGDVLSEFRIDLPAVGQRASDRAEAEQGGRTSYKFSRGWRGKLERYAFDWMRYPHIAWAKLAVRLFLDILFSRSVIFDGKRPQGYELNLAESAVGKEQIIGFINHMLGICGKLTLGPDYIDPHTGKAFDGRCVADYFFFGQPRSDTGAIYMMVVHRHPCIVVGEFHNHMDGFNGESNSQMHNAMWGVINGAYDALRPPTREFRGEASASSEGQVGQRTVQHVYLEAPTMEYDLRQSDAAASNGTRNRLVETRLPLGWLGQQNPHRGCDIEQHSPGLLMHLLWVVWKLRPHAPPPLRVPRPKVKRPRESEVDWARDVLGRWEAQRGGGGAAEAEDAGPSAPARPSKTDLATAKAYRELKERWAEYEAGVPERARYERELAEWREADKAARGDKPLAPEVPRKPKKALPSGVELDWATTVINREAAWLAWNMEHGGAAEAPRRVSRGVTARDARDARAVLDLDDEWAAYDRDCLFDTAEGDNALDLEPGTSPEVKSHITLMSNRARMLCQAGRGAENADADHYARLSAHFINEAMLSSVFEDPEAEAILPDALLDADEFSLATLHVALEADRDVPKGCGRPAQMAAFSKTLARLHTLGYDVLPKGAKAVMPPEMARLGLVSQGAVDRTVNRSVGLRQRLDQTNSSRHGRIETMPVLASFMATRGDVHYVEARPTAHGPIADRRRFVARLLEYAYYGAALAKAEEVGAAVGADVFAFAWQAARYGKALAALGECAGDAPVEAARAWVEQTVTTGGAGLSQAELLLDGEGDVERAVALERWFGDKVAGIRNAVIVVRRTLYRLLSETDGEPEPGVLFYDDFVSARYRFGGGMKKLLVGAGAGEGHAALAALRPWLPRAVADDGGEVKKKRPGG